MQIKYFIAKGRNENVLLDEEIKEISWEEYYGILPNTEPYTRSNFALIQTVPIPVEDMFTGLRIEILLDVVENGSSGKEKSVSYQKKFSVLYDENYIGYYCNMFLKKLGLLPERISVDKLEEFDPNSDLKTVDKQFSIPAHKQRWDTLRQLTLKAAVVCELNKSLEVDMSDVEAFISMARLPEDKAEIVRQKAKTDPRGYAALKEAVFESMNKLL